MSKVTFQGKPVELSGQEINLGDRAPQVRLVAQDLSEIEIASGKHVQIIVAVARYARLRDGGTQVQRARCIAS